MLQGYIETYNEAKGYGFVSEKSNYKRYFFYKEESAQQLKVGDEVTYELKEGVKGTKQAYNLKVI